MNEKNRWRGAMPAILLAISIGFLDAPFVHAGDRQALRADQVQAGTLLLATHSGDVAALCDRSVELRDGRLHDGS